MDAFDRMREEGIEPDAVTWNTLIDAHCKGGRHDRAMELFEEVRESNCRMLCKFRTYLRKFRTF